MFNCFATLNFDTEFRVPPDCLREGDVTCRVVRAECAVIDTWDRWVTIKVRLLLKITIRSGELVCSFTREVVAKETVWLEHDAWINRCEVVAAACRCVVNRGKVHCNLTVKVEFFVKRKHHDSCCCKRSCGCPRCDHDWKDDCDRDWERDDDCCTRRDPCVIKRDPCFTKRDPCFTKRDPCFTKVTPCNSRCIM